MAYNANTGLKEHRIGSVRDGLGLPQQVIVLMQSLAVLAFTKSSLHPGLALLLRVTVLHQPLQLELLYREEEACYSNLSGRPRHAAKQTSLEGMVPMKA